MMSRMLATTMLRLGRQVKIATGRSKSIKIPLTLPKPCGAQQPKKPTVSGCGGSIVDKKPATSGSGCGGSRIDKKPPTRGADCGGNDVNKKPETICGSTKPSAITCCTSRRCGTDPTPVKPPAPSTCYVTSCTIPKRPKVAKCDTPGTKLSVCDGSSAKGTDISKK